MCKRLRAASLALAPALFALAALAEDFTFDLKIEREHIAPAEQLIHVHQGDKITLRWTSDRPLVLHLHGYDIETRVAPGVASDLAFTADIAGRFPVEIHRSGVGAGGAHSATPLAIIEVYPR